MLLDRGTVLLRIRGVRDPGPRSRDPPPPATTKWSSTPSTACRKTEAKSVTAVYAKTIMPVCARTGAAATGIAASTRVTAMS